MLSCALSEPRTSPRSLEEDKHLPSPNSSGTSLDALNWHWNVSSDYYPSEEVAKAQLQPASPNLSVRVDYQNVHSGPHSSTSSTGAPMSDISTSNTPPSIYKPLRTSFERRESQASGLSTPPEHLRHTHRSSSNLSTLTASFSLPRPFSFSTSAASSPPNTRPKKRLSPADHGTSSTITWSPAFLGRSSIIREDPRPSLTLSISDNEEEVPPAPKKRGFGIKLKNQDQFHNEGYANFPLLDPSEEWRYCAYREAYSHLLYVWGMPVARAEVLKYNHLPAAGSAPSYASHQNTASLLAIDKTDLKTSNTEAADLGFRHHCRSCAFTISPKPAHRRCQSCSTRQLPPICLLCATLICGTSSPCLKCGHALHASCRELLAQTPADVPNECISGCGCICTDHPTVAIQAPELTTKRSFEVSPAITIIGDTGMSEQEQLGWRESGKWQDAAYQSLAQNLVPRQEVRAKSSQIWRGRMGSM